MNVNKQRVIWKGRKKGSLFRSCIRKSVQIHLYVFICRQIDRYEKEEGPKEV